MRTMWHTTHLVCTPVFNDQHQQIGAITMHGATKAALEALPAHLGGGNG